MKFSLISTLLIGSLTSFASMASGITTQKNLSLELADQLAQGVIQSCSAKDHQIAVTVVDRAGTILVTKKMDNAGPHTLEASRMKAFTALSTKNTTENVMKASQSNAGAANINDIPGFLLLAGGVPVKVDAETIGAIGVGGAPGGHIDQECALDALKSISLI